MSPPRADIGRSSSQPPSGGPGRRQLSAADVAALIRDSQLRAPRTLHRRVKALFEAARDEAATEGHENRG